MTCICHAECNEASHSTVIARHGLHFECRGNLGNTESFSWQRDCHADKSARNDEKTRNDVKAQDDEKVVHLLPFDFQTDTCYYVFVLGFGFCFFLLLIFAVLCFVICFLLLIVILK